MVTSITLPITLLVLLAGLAHAVWNAIAKSYQDQWASFTLLNIGVAVPCLIALPIVGLPRTAAWGYLATAVCCHILYELFLMSAYRHGSLSRSYPIARGVAPALTTLGALVVAGEHPGALALFGIAGVVGGIVSLALYDREATSLAAVLWALATGVMIAAYTLVDGLGVRVSHDPLRYTVALFSIQATAFVIGAWRTGKVSTSVFSHRAVRGLLAGVLSLVGYGIVLYAQTRAPLGVVSALRETGVVWAALLGVVLFKERGGWRLLVAALVVAAGVACIAVG